MAPCQKTTARLESRSASGAARWGCLSPLHDLVCGLQPVLRAQTPNHLTSPWSVPLLPSAAPHPKHAKESACGCAGLFSAPVALALYAHAFEEAGALQHLEAFASFNGPDFYGLPRNTGGRPGHRAWAMPVRAIGQPTLLASCTVLWWVRCCHACPGPTAPAARMQRPFTPPCPPCPAHADKVTLRRQPWTVPASYEFGDAEVVPMWAGQECPWTVVA